MSNLRSRAEEIVGATLSSNSPSDVGDMSMQQIIHDLRVHQIELEMQNEELRRTQTELDTAQASFFDFYDMAPVGYVSLDRSGRILQANLTTAKLLGLARGNLVQKTFNRFVRKEDQDVYYRLFKQAVNTAQPQSTELRLCRSDGKVFWVKLVAVAATSDGCPPLLRFVLVDITEQKQAEAALQASRTLRDAILDSVSSQIAVLDRSGTIVAVNQAWQRFALDNATVAQTPANNTQIGTSCLRICEQAIVDSCGEAAQAREGILKVIAGDLPRFHLDYPCHLPAQQRWFDLRVTPLNAEGQGVVVTHTEITERKKLQAAQLELSLEAGLAASRQELRELMALNQAKREEDRKHLAREMHDELGQMLTLLRMDLSLLGIRFGELDPALRTEVQTMKEQVDSALVHVHDVITFLRPEALNLGLVPAMEWLCHEFSRVNHLPCELAAPGELNLDDSRAVVIFRIAQESLTNITRYAQASLVSVRLGCHGHDLRLEVSDNGCGFDVQAAGQQRSFGLLGMRERAISLGGALEITSAPGQGTMVALTIPFRVGKKSDSI